MKTDSRLPSPEVLTQRVLFELPSVVGDDDEDEGDVHTVYPFDLTSGQRTRDEKQVSISTFIERKREDSLSFSLFRKLCDKRQEVVGRG